MANVGVRITHIEMYLDFPAPNVQEDAHLSGWYLYFPRSRCGYYNLFVVFDQ